MSFPTIPDIDPNITLTVCDSVNLLLASVAFEELSLSHIMNAEAEKIQSVLGTLKTHDWPFKPYASEVSGDSAEASGDSVFPPPPPPPPTINELLELDRSVDMTLRHVIKTQMLLQFKLEDVLAFSAVTADPPQAAADDGKGE